MPSELESFAERVRRQCNRIMGATAGGYNDQAGKLAAELCTEAARIIQQKKMAEETADPDRYDLAALPASSAFDE